MKNIKRRLVAIAFALTTGSFCSQVSASAFQSFEYNAVNLGDFGAGGAAIAQDASTAYANPAGLSRLTHPQIVLSVDDVITRVRFNGSNTFSFLTPEQGTANGDTSNIIPSFHYAMPLSEAWTFGFSVTSPFSASTDYGTSSILRYSATKTELTTYDISPSIAYKINDQWSVGIGFDAERANATFNSALPDTSPFDSISKNKGSGWGYGWHTGILYQPTNSTRIGLAYHSQIHIKVAGTSKLTQPSSGQVFTSRAVAGLALPPTTELSAYHDITESWAIDGTLVYTQWSTFNNLTLRNVATPVGPIVASIPAHYHNSWRFAVGTNYKVTPDWLLRMGVGYDQSPVPNSTRDTRLPDSNRIGVALGTHYQIIKSLGVDVGWTHLFFKSTRINAPSYDGSLSTANGNYHNSADIVGAQLTWDIA